MTAQKHLAIVGTGIAGLGCLYFLHPHYKITLYEQNEYVGGHTNTVEVTEDGKQLPIDTGFMVFNYQTYPLLTQLFDTLQVPVKKTDMSFSVRHDHRNLEWNGAGYNKLFGQRKNLLNLRFWRMLSQMARFCKEAVDNLENPRYEKLTVAELIAERGYGPDFLELFLVPMSSAIWSTPPQQMLQFPARTLIRFFYNHGFLGMDTHHQWYTVDGGAREYVKKILTLTRPEILLAHPVQRVVRLENGQVQVTAATTDGKPHQAVYDGVILAAHADQSLRLLQNPTPLQQATLTPFQYAANTARLHTDTSVLPKTRRCWAAWNYQIQPKKQQQGAVAIADYQAATHYWMNRLQGVSKTQNYVVSISGGEWLDPAQVCRTIAYEHPVFDVEAIQAQTALPELNREGQRTGVYFAGSYFRYGFHEDAFGSSVALCQQLLGDAFAWPR